MKTSDRPIFTSIIILTLLTVCVQTGFAQNNRLQSPFAIGLKGGANLSHVRVLGSYDIFSSLDGEEPPPKVYNSIFRNPGYQYGFVGFYKLGRNLNLIFEPTFTHYVFTYTKDVVWQDTGNAGFSRTSSQTHKQNLRYIEFPVLVQYYLDYTPLKPYVLAGAHYGYLLGAEKILTVEEFTTLDNQTFHTSTENQHVYSNDQYIRSRVAILAEIGAIYDLTALQIIFGLGYTYSFFNISRENERYSNHLVSGLSYDVNDDLLLNAINFNLRVIFPINKPSNLVKSLKCK